MTQFRPNSSLKRFAAGLLLLVTSTCRAEDAVPPNIVHIVADDLGWNDVGFHGSEIHTPAIDELATQSVVLDRFYVTPICSPTRAGMLTGRYPFRFGIWGGVVSPTKRHGLPPRETTLAELLESRGYQHRGMFGKWHLGHSSTLFHPLNHGFTLFYGHYNGAIDYFSRKRVGQLDWHCDFDSVHEEGYSTDLVGQAAADFIDATTADSPFYMVVAFNAPHSPIQALRTDLEQYQFHPDGPRAPNTDAKIAKREDAPDYGVSGKGNTVRQTFSAMVSALDRNVDRILKAIDRSGRGDDTIVIFHSDNGGDPRHGGNNKPLRGKKFTTWEGGVRVVALIRWPARLPAGTKFQSLASYIDLLPTLSAATGREPPDETDGINLLPFLTGKQRPPNRSLLLSEDTVLTDRWKLKGDEVFDLRADPYEQSPVQNPPSNIVARLRQDLARFQDLSGPKTTTQLPLPTNWPPKEWQLPDEPETKEPDGS